jgi:hypothetical protein
VDDQENFSGKYKDKMAEIEAKRQQLPQNIRIRSTSRSKANGPNPQTKGTALLLKIQENLSSLVPPNHGSSPLKPRGRSSSNQKRGATDSPHENSRPFTTENSFRIKMIGAPPVQGQGKPLQSGPGLNGMGISAKPGPKNSTSTFVQ